MKPRYAIAQVLAVLVAALAIACGGGGDDPEPTGGTGGGSTGASTGSTGGGSSACSGGDISCVQPAVIQIVSQGTFRDPELGLADGSGAGSGFIISSDGLAVTNNHVVAGAATIEVFIGGDDSRGYNASIIGVSECNDLALIDIRESEPLPFLEWYEGEVSPGTDVYTAGFPLGDPEYTLTRGIVSKARASGESDWSSLDYAIEHDATIQGGNSGGPLVTADGKVLGINYASSTGTNSSIYYAIPGEVAQDIIELLKEDDYETIGINAWAVFDEALNISGIWVASVSAGSPAAKAGILAGDIITSLNGLPMAMDGTMADYCDVFRTSGDDQPMSVEVLRYDTGEILRGEINSDSPIEVVSIAAAIEDDTDVDTGGGGAADTTTYVSVEDNGGEITVDVPQAWTDINGAPCDYNGSTIPCLTVSTNITSWNETWTTPGLFFTAFDPPEDINTLLADYGFPNECQDGGIFEYSDALYTGRYQIWENCGGVGSYLIVLAAAEADNSYTALMQFVIVSDADWDHLDKAFATFYKIP
jgi:serine protease Do